MQHASEMSPRHVQESVTWTMIDPEGLNNPCSALLPEMMVHKYLTSLLVRLLLLPHHTGFADRMYIDAVTVPNPAGLQVACGCCQSCDDVT